MKEIELFPLSYFMKYQKLVYLASKYSDPSKRQRKKNVKKAGDIAHKIMSKGYAVISPVNNSDWNGKEVDFSHDEWLQMDFEILKRCDLLVLGNDWENSQGCLAELEFALKHKIPVKDFKNL